MSANDRPENQHSSSGANGPTYNEVRDALVAELRSLKDQQHTDDQANRTTDDRRHFWNVTTTIGVWIYTLLTLGIVAISICQLRQSERNAKQQHDDTSNALKTADIANGIVQRAAAEQLSAMRSQIAEMQKQSAAMAGQQGIMQGQLAEVIATRKDAEAQSRAQFVYIDPAMFPMNAKGAQVGKDSRDIVGWSVSPGWKNIGSTAAVSFTSAFDLSIKPRDWSKDIHEIYKSCPARPKLPYPGIRVVPNADGIELGKILSLDDAARAEHGLQAIFLVFDATYKDIFQSPGSAPHHYHVCVLIDVHDAARSAFSFLQVYKQLD